MRLDEAIRSLLRPPRPGRPGPLVQLPAIGPAVGAADWPAEARWQGGVWWQEVVVAVLRIEPGLLALATGIDDVEYPVLLARPDWLETWAGGAGVTVPGSDPARTALLLGLLADDPTLVPPLDWPDGPDYQGRVYTTAARLTAVLKAGQSVTEIGLPVHLMSGGARLWGESCVASGVALSARMPVGCSTWYGSLGLLWAPPDPGSEVPRPWAMAISQSGCHAWPLALSDLGAQMAAWVWSGEISGATAGRLAIGYALASARPATGASAIECLSASEIADAYAGGGPLAHGWHWRWADPWAADAREVAEAHITTTRASATAWVSRTSSVAIEWTLTDGVYLPSATLSAGDDEEWGGGGARLHIPGLTGVTTLPPGATIDDTEATVYTWTTAEGGVSHLVRLETDPGGGTSTTGSSAWPVWCGPGSQTNTYDTHVSGWSGGWEVRGDGASTARVAVLTSATIESTHAEVVVEDTWTATASGGYSVRIATSGYLCQGSSPDGNWYNCTVTVGRGTWSSWIERTVLSGGTGGAGAALLPDDTGVALVYGQTWTSGTRKRADAVPDAGSQRNVGLVTISTSAGTRAWTSSNLGGGGVNRFRARLVGPGGVGEYADTGMLRNGYYGVSLPATGTDYLSERAAVLVPSSGVPHVLDADDWADLAGVVEDAQVPSARCSYSGLACLITEPAGDWECADPAIPAGTQPVAWALG